MPQICLFQSTPPRGRRPTPPGRAVRCREVSIHASAREATQTRASAAVHHLFQSTPPRGRRPAGASGAPRGRVFQSTPPRGRRPSMQAQARMASYSFNPRLRAGGDCRWTGGRPPPEKVSIHASAREATSMMMPSNVSSGFQSTPPRGRRRPPSSGRPCRRRVSIHASAREATRRRATGHLRRERFNPRLRAGGDPSRPSPRATRTSFNPRLRAGGDAVRTWWVTRGEGFNPRLRAGGDRRSRSGSARERRCFNPRLRAGGDDLIGSVRGHGVEVSIHASAREATCSRAGLPSAPSRFQSTPPRGRRPCFRVAS